MPALVEGHPLELAEVLFAEKVGAAQHAITARVARDREFAQRLEPLIGAMNALQRAQEAEDDAIEAAYDARVGDAQVDLAQADSPDWDDIDELIAFLREGPSQPARAAELAAKRSAEATARTESAHIGSAVELYARPGFDAREV